MRTSTGRALDLSVYKKIKTMAGKGKGKADNETGSQHHGYASKLTQLREKTFIWSLDQHYSSPICPIQQRPWIYKRYFQILRL